MLSSLLSALGTHRVSKSSDLPDDLPLLTRIGAHISALCRRLRIPVNVSDSPALSTFTLLSTYNDGPLQIGITTSGRGCKLASRIRREIGASLPSDIGSAVERLGTLRRRLQEEDRKHGQTHTDELEHEDDESGQSATFNQLVLEHDVEQAKTRRLRWLSQICEYWPLKKLATISDADVDRILASYRESSESSPAPVSKSQPTVAPNRGRIILAGSGPGSPELLTGATLTAIKTADVILADKLVPAAVLDLIPRRTTVHIARKFPGNAEAAQDELMQLGLAGVTAGKTVLRLKQGDPYLYGRGGEEVLWFRERGYEAIVLPGLTSSLSAPLFASIPVTQRAVADQVLICTGMGRAGKAPVPPEYVASRTTVFLMALHRLPSMVESLTGFNTVKNAPAEEGVLVAHNRWPISTPCTIIERASCRDQRVIRTTLEHVCAAVEELGSLPPGLLVVGNACGVLEKVEGRWKVEEGFMDLSTLGSDANNAWDVMDDSIIEEMEKKEDVTEFNQAYENKGGMIAREVEITA